MCQRGSRGSGGPTGEGPKVVLYISNVSPIALQISIGKVGSGAKVHADSCAAQQTMPHAQVLLCIGS